LTSRGYCWIPLRIRSQLSHPSSDKKTKLSSFIRRRHVFLTQMTGKQMVVEFLKMMEVMTLPITRTKIRKSTSFPKQNQKTVNAQQLFSRGRTGRTFNILISAEELMKCSGIMGTSSRLNNLYFYITVSVENPMQSLPNRTAILSREAR